MKGLHGLACGIVLGFGLAGYIGHSQNSFNLPNCEAELLRMRAEQDVATLLAEPMTATEARILTGALSVNPSLAPFAGLITDMLLPKQMGVTWIVRGKVEARPIDGTGAQYMWATLGADGKIANVEGPFPAQPMVTR